MSIVARTRLRSQLALIGVLVAPLLYTQRSPFNGLEVRPADSTGHFRILIGGHFHGESNNRSGFPAGTLLANLDTINHLGVDLFLSTGDLFMDPVNDQARYAHAFFSKLEMPLFNAPGNHDASGRVEDTGILSFRLGDRSIDSTLILQQLYAAPRNGTSSVVLAYLTRALWNIRQGVRIAPGGDQCLVMDLERQDGKVGKEQIDALQRFANLASGEGSNSAHLFIISHRPVWAEDDPRYSPLFEGNTRSLTGTNFTKEVYPLLEKIAEYAHVYWISGSMGGFAPSSIFFQEHAHNITYIQCAIRNEPRDALLIADVYPDTVEWSSFSLTGQKMLAPEKYDAAWWKAHPLRRDAMNWRMLPYLIRTTVLHRAFWWGVGAALLLVLLLRRLFRRGL